MIRFLLLTVVLIITACATGQPSPTLTSEPPPSTATTESIPTPTPLPTKIPNPPTPTPAPITEEVLLHALLTLDDMPTGWSLEKSGIEEKNEDPTYTFLCKDLQSRALDSANAEFSAGELGPVLHHNIAVYQSDDAKKAFSDLVSTYLECPGWTVTNEDGTEEAYRLSLISFSELGDESFAVRVTTEIPSLGTLTFNSVFIRQGRIITSIGHLSIGPVDSEQTEMFAALAFRKLQKSLAP